MAKLKDKTGQRNGKLVALDVVRVDGVLRYRCKCDCGNEKLVRTSAFLKTSSCGCYMKSKEWAERCQKHCSTHGHGTKRIGVSKTWSSWTGMVARCTNPKHSSYARYGGRGISVCDRWRLFENFLADMGERPAGLTLDRFPDKDGNYEPGNCRWATYTAQARNSSFAVLTPAMVNELHGRLDHGEPIWSVAKRLGVRRSAVEHARAGRTWKEFKDEAKW